MADLGDQLGLYNVRPLRDIILHINILSLPRGVVDTVADLGDQLGLYTHCVTVELGDGRIVNQGPCVQLPRYSKYCVNMREPFIHTLFN